MELYLSACSKAAEAIATKMASSSAVSDSQQCGDGTHRTHFPSLGAAQLLDLPLGAKLPVIPGSNTVFYTTNLSEKLFRPSYDFNLTDPYCRLLENQYKSLHDPHLKAYYKRKDMLRKLKKGGYITSNNKIVCSLREWNKYRQYLTSLKLDFERNYAREQKILAKRINKLQEDNHIPEGFDVAQFQNWLLQERTRTIKDQDWLIRHRYLDMISKELGVLERTAEEQRQIQRAKEERQQQEHARRKLTLRRKIEEEWKEKEMLLLMKIGEDVKREARIEEERHKNREESHRKKQAFLEKKMAYHLQKLQEISDRREKMEKNTFENRGQDGPLSESGPKRKKIYDEGKSVHPTYKGVNGYPANNGYQSRNSSMNVTKKSSISIVSQPNVQDNSGEKNREVMTKQPSTFENQGAINISTQASAVLAQTSPTKNTSKLFQSFVGHPKEEMHAISFTSDAGKMNQETDVYPSERSIKKSCGFCESGPQVHTTAQGDFPSHIPSNIQQNLLPSCLHRKVTSEELNSIIQNIMTWVVATVTSILYPAITKYEDRLRNYTYPVSDDSVLSSDSSSFCSTCSEEFAYGSYTSATTKTFQTEPYTWTTDMSVRQPGIPFNHPPAHMERTLIEETYHKKRQNMMSGLKLSKPQVTYGNHKLRSCKSDSHLLASSETSTKISKDATTETDSLERPQFSDQKLKAINEMKKLKKVLVNFKCHLKGETELVLENILQEIMSDLTNAIPSLSSVTAEVFVDQHEADKSDVLNSSNISSVAADIVENMLEKLQSTVEQKCVEVISQEDLSVHVKPDRAAGGKYFTSSSEKPSAAPKPDTLEPMCDVAEDMVHAILEKLMTLASCKQNELHIKDATKHCHQQHETDPTYMFLQRADENKSSSELENTNLIIKEEIQNLVSTIFSQSSLVGYIEEAISTILGYVQTELNSERLFASEETVILLQLLDDIFTQLRQKSLKAGVQKNKCCRTWNPSAAEEKSRPTGTRLSDGRRPGRPFSPINVPGMVLYSEDDNEEIDKIVKNVLDSSFKDEKPKFQGHILDHSFTKGSNSFEHKTNTRQPTKPVSQCKVAFHDWELKTNLPSFNNEDLLKRKACLSKDILIFRQDQKCQIQKASEDIVKSVLTEMLKDISSFPLVHLDGENGKETSVLSSGKPQGLSYQEWMGQMFSVSEISTVAQDITDGVLNILHKASNYITDTTNDSLSSSVHQTSLDSSDPPHMAKKARNGNSLKLWFDSENKMKYLPSLSTDPSKPSWLESEKRDLESVDDVNDEIINAVFKKLKLLVCPKLQMGFKTPLTKQSSLRSQLSAYTTKIVNIVLHAIQNELEPTEKNKNLREINSTKTSGGKGSVGDTDKKLDSLVTDLNDDIMGSPLIAFICNILSNQNADQTSAPLPADKQSPETPCKSENIYKKTLPNKQDEKSIFSHLPSVHEAVPPKICECLGTPCIFHSIFSGKELKEKARLEVVDSIGEILYEMLCKLLGIYGRTDLACNKQNREKTKETPQTATDLKSNIRFISKTILEYIVAKLCSIDTGNGFVSSGFQAVSDYLDIDSLSFTSIIEEMAKCTDIISSLVSRMIPRGNKELHNNRAKTTASVAPKTKIVREMHPKKLKAVASDILSMVFDKLEGFANGNLETLGSTNDGNKPSSKMDWNCETPSVSTDIHEELLQSALYLHSKKLSNALLKAIQNELNVNPSDLRSSVKSPPLERQIITDVVNLILDAASSDVLNETESEERDTESYRYRPTYGNFLPGGAESDSSLEDATHTEKKSVGAGAPLVEEIKPDSLTQRVLEKTLNKIEVELREPQTSPIMPIIKNMLNEIFQNALVNQLNLFPFTCSHLSSLLHSVDEPVAQTSGQLSHLISETDVTVVADDFVRTVFHKLHSAAMSEKTAGKSKHKHITFSPNIYFHEHTNQGTSSVTVLDRNPHTLHPGFSVDKQTRENMIEDTVQTVLTNLETFATSKVKSLFCPQVSFTAPVTLPIQQDKSALDKVLPTEDSCSNDKFFSSSMDHMKPVKNNPICQLSLSKLNIYAKEVARKILQGIKHELDKEMESPFFTRNIVVSERIACQVVNTMLDIMSSKGKCEKINSNKEINSDQQESVIEKLFSKTEYQKVLQFQIQDTVESVLSDIYEKTLEQNNLLLATSTLSCNIDGKYSESNSEMFIDSTNTVNPILSVLKSDVLMLANDVVDIVLRNLYSAVMLSMNGKNSIAARLPVTLCDDVLPKAECQQPALMDSKTESKTESFPFSGNLKSLYAADNQVTVVEKEDSKKLVPDPCEESANFITQTIFNRLESFATERIDSLITLAFQTKEKFFVSPELETCKQHDRVFYVSSQVESDVNVLKIPTEPIFHPEVTDSTLASYREKHRPKIHVSQASLKEYADVIASTILKLIKNDLDLEIQKMCPYSNNILLQENIIVSEIVNNILKILYDKRSAKEISIYSKQKTNLFPQLSVSNEILLEQKKVENNTKLSRSSNYPLENNQITSEMEDQRTVLEEIFMQHEEPIRQKEKTALISAVEDILNKLCQRVMEVIGHLSPLNEPPKSVSNSKIKTSEVTENYPSQSHINSVAADLVADVLEKMYSVIVKCLYEYNKMGEVEESESSDLKALPVKPGFRQTKQAGKGSDPPRCVIPQVYPCTSSQNISFMENTLLQYSPLQAGKDLVQIVLSKIRNFVSLRLEDNSFPEDTQAQRLHGSKFSPKGSPKPEVKTSLKSKSKSTFLPKFRTKPHLGPSGAKAKNKTKLCPGEKTPRYSRSKTTIGLSNILSTGDTKKILETKLPTSELKIYSKDIVSSILEIIMKELENVKENQAVVNTKALPSDQVLAAHEIVHAVLQGLYATKSHNLTHLDDVKLSYGDTGAKSLSKPQPCFFLENVSSQLEQIFPKKGILKKMFDKWQTESDDTDNEKCKLLMIAETVLTELSIKAKELEYSVSLLNMSPLEAYESRFCHRSKRSATGAEDPKAQINMFGKEIVEMLFEKLQVCFLTQMSTPDTNETPASRKEHISAKTKHSSSTRPIFSNVTSYNTRLKDQISLDPSSRIVREIVERVLNMLESFVDLQFKCISKYEFSELVKMPKESFYPLQQRLVSKKMLPKLQPLKNFSDDTESSTVISKENTEDIFLQIHSFYSELLTYAANAVSEMLGIIKNKLDEEISQVEPNSVSLSKENIVASEIIGTMIDQCTHFRKSLIESLPKESSFQRVEKAYIVNPVELSNNTKMPTSKLRETSFGNNLPQTSVPGLMERTHSETTLLCSGYTVQSQNSRKPNYGHSSQAITGSNFLPESSMLQKLCKKANASTETALKQAMAFIETGKGEHPRESQYETLQPVVEPAQIQTTVSPLKICLAAENIVSTVLSSYGFPSQTQTNGSMETMKPFFVSQQSPLSVMSEEEKNEAKNLLRMWDNRISCTMEEQCKNPEVNGDFSSLPRWTKGTQDINKTEALEEVEVITFADHELGPNEIDLVARHVTRSVVTHFKNFEIRVSSEEKLSIVSTLSRKKYESNQPLKSTHSDSSLNLFCEHLTELVMYHLISRICDGSKENGEEVEALEHQDTALNKIISIHSQVFQSRSISIGELASSISEIIIRILSNSNVIKADTVQQMTSVNTKYIYCPGVAAADFDDLFQDLLVGVIHILSKNIGINHHFKSNGRNKSDSTIRTHRVPICCKTNAMEGQIDPRDSESSICQSDQLIQKNKLNHLACKLGSLVDSLKTQESKEVVNKVFNIVLDVFLPDECPDVSMDSSKTKRTFFPFSNNQEGNNIGLSPKSVFLLNVVCEKLVRILLEKCTNTGSCGNNNPPSDEISEENQFLKILQSIENQEVDYCKDAVGCQPLQDYTSDFLEHLAKEDQDLLSSDSMLNMISHSLVKSLMEKLSHSMQYTSESLPSDNKDLMYRTKEIHSSFTKVKRPELDQDQDSLGFMNHDSNPLRRPQNNPSIVRPKIQKPFGKQISRKSSMSPFKRQGTKEINTTAVNNMLHPGGMNTGVYSATFLENIISELFFNLSISLWGKDENITEAWLNEMNTLFINSVVNEFNNAHVTVVRNAEETLCFPPVHKQTVSQIVDSVYNDVLQHYKVKVTCGNNTAHDNTTIAEQITNGILLETLDYQLPSYFQGKLIPSSYYPLEAEIILQKLQSNLRKFTSQPRFSTGYSTMLPCSFLEDVIRRLLSQLIPPPSESSSLGKKYLMSSDFDEMSTCIVNKVVSAISKHKICFTIYDNEHLYTGKNLQKMVDSVYRNILQMSDSLTSIQKSIVSQSPLVADRIASCIIQEIIENHLQPFLCGETLPRPKTPLDEISEMVKHILSDVTESHRSQKPSPLSFNLDTFVGEIVARLLVKIFIPKSNTEVDLEKMTQKIVNSVNNHFDKAKIYTLHDDKEQSYPLGDTDVVDKLVTSVYRNVLKQHGLDFEVDEESKGNDFFVENVTTLIVAAILDYLLHPLFSGDLSDSSHSTSVAENIVHDLLSSIIKSTKPSQSLSPYNTLLPYTFLEDMIRVLLSRIFPSTSSMVLNGETSQNKSRVNFNEIASKLISDIRMKISQHEIRFSKDEEEAKSVYSEDDVQYLVDSVFRNILQNSGSQESIEEDITDSNDVLIDRIAGFIIKNICEKHLQPFVDGKSLTSSSCTHFDDERRQLLYTSVYSSSFLEDVVSGVLSKIFHRLLGIVPTKSVSDSEDELLEIAEKLIPLIIEEFSKTEVSILENAEKQLGLPPVDSDIVIKIIDIIYSRFLQEYVMEVIPSKDFLNDTETLAARITEIILSEIFDFQIHPEFIAKLPIKPHSKLSADVLFKRVRCGISKSGLKRQAPTTYTTMLSHTHLEKIVTQLISQMNPLASSVENQDTAESDVSNTVMKLIHEIMSIISKHAICITRHGSEKQSMISEKDIQSILDSIYADLSYSHLYQSLRTDKKGISNIPVSKIASVIIKEIFNHHLQSFLSGDKTLLSPSVDQTYNQKAINSKQRELSFIVNSTAFLEDVISELLCKILYTFSRDVFATENPSETEAEIIDIVTTLAKSIVLEFTTSEILLVDNVDENLCFSEEYKEMVQNTASLAYEKILGEYKSLSQVYRAVQSDTMCFGRKIYHLLLEEIYDYQVQSLVSGESIHASYSLPQAGNIIRKVLSTIIMENCTLPSYITVLPRSLLEDMIYKLLTHIFPLTNPKHKHEEVPSDYEFLDTASKLTDDIITEITEHEVRFDTSKENIESMQLETIENLVDSICNNILKKSEFQAEVQKGAHKKGTSFLNKIAGFIMKEIMNHHLQPFLHSEEAPSSDLSDYDRVSVLPTPCKEKTQPSLYSATFLEDVIVDLVRKFYSLPSVTEDSEKREMPKPDIVSLAIEFANSLIREFRKSEIKVLPNAEEIFCFPPIDKETVDKISNFVYDQFIVKCGSDDTCKNDKNNIFIEMISSLAQKAISAFKIQPLFSGDWSSTFFSFLNPENITQRVQHLPQETSTQIKRYLKGKQHTLPEESHKHTSLTSGQKNNLDTLETDRDRMSRKESFNKETKSMKKVGTYDPLVTFITGIRRSGIISQASASGMAKKKKKSEDKMETAVQKCNKNVSSTSVKSKGSQEPDWSVVPKNNEIKRKSITYPKDEEEQSVEVQTLFSVVTEVTKCEKRVPKSDFEIHNEKKDKRESLLENDDDTFEVSSMSNMRNEGITSEKLLKTDMQKPSNDGTRGSSTQTVTDEEQYLDHNSVQNVIENIYDDVLEIFSQEPADDSKLQSLPRDKTLHVIQEDSLQFVSTKGLCPSVSKNGPTKEKEQEENEIKLEPGNPDSSQYSTENKLGIFPANFLEDIVTEIIKKLIFSSPPETQTSDSCHVVTDDENKAELYNTAMKLIDSLLKEFSEAHIEVFRPGKGNQSFPQAGKISSAPNVPPRQKEPTSDEASSSIGMTTVDKMAPGHKMTDISSSNKVPFLDKMPAFDKTLVNKIVHSSLCSILKEYGSQDSVCKNINTDRENLARRLTSAVINEIFQHQLNLIFGDEVPASACLPLQSKDVIEKIQRVACTASKECQTSSPYTIMLPHKFLENVISSLLCKVFVTTSNTNSETSKDSFFTDWDFHQMKLVNTVISQISKDEDMVIQYVESLHPNDDEITQSVVQSIYNNLLPQFGSQEIIRDCVASGCRILSEAIVDLVVREVAGNQLQNYFSGELTPHQCAQVDSIVENILKEVIQTTSVPQHQQSQVHKLSYNIVEEIAVKFLSKLLSVFLKVNKGRTKSWETEMQKITSKILNSVQGFISKSQIKLVPPAKESPTVPLVDNTTIENVVNSVYTSVLKHSGSHTSIFKDLLGNSNVLSDIIGFLMVKEISNSQFQPQVEKEVSNSELALEAVEIMEKVINIIDELKSQEKFSSRKDFVLEATFLEETLALLLAKMVRLPIASIKKKNNLPKPEFAEIASQLTKSVTAEISKSNINLVAADPKEHFLNPESVEMVSQVVNSVYSDVLQQCGTHEDLYSDIKGTNSVFPRKVASLIINSISDISLNKISSKHLNDGLLGELDTDRIVQKAQEYAVKITPDLEEESDHGSLEEELPVKIVPHIRNRPISIDPTVISEHLAVISIKTQPLEKLKMECLRQTGQTITELRKASISGKSYTTQDESDGERRKKERRTSLNKMGRLDVKPFEAVGRNSFQNIIKPDLTRVELLKDVKSKQDLLIRLIAHDIDEGYSETNVHHGLTSDEEEVVLTEVTVPGGFLGETSEGKVKEAVKSAESKVASPNPTISTSSLRKLLSLSKCCQPTSSANIKSIEATTSSQITESKDEQIKRVVATLNMASTSTAWTKTGSVFLEKKSQHMKEEQSLANEPAHHFLHRIMSTSSYNQEDLISSAGETADCTTDPRTNMLEEGGQEPMQDKANSVEFFTIYEGYHRVTQSECPSKEAISEIPKSTVSKQGSKMLAKVSSALSKVFSRSNTGVSKSSPPPHQKEH